MMVSFAGQPAFAVEPKHEPKRVLLLYYSFGGNLVTAAGIRAELDRRSPEVLEIYDAPFLTVRPEDEGAAGRYADYLGALLPDQRLDLAVTVGGAGVRFFQRYRERLFPAAPMLAIAEQRRIPFSNLRENDTVVSTSINLAGVVDNILQVLPETTNVAVVIGNSSVEQEWLEQMHIAFRPFAKRVSFTYFNNLSLDGILNRAATLPPRSAIFLLLLLSDASGATHEDTKVLSRLRAVAKAPIFSYYDANFGNGIVGGPLISVRERGRRAASVALRILDGEPPGNIKIPPIGSATPKFDWREMQRWKISESRLPPGSEIHFRDQSAWEPYRRQILAICAALLIQAALIGWLIYEHRRRHLAELQARHSMSELAHMNRVATAGQLSASIAHEISQPLTGIATRAGAALRWLAAETPDLERARAALTQVVSATHRAGDIIKNIRAMFGRDTGERFPIDINKLILAVLSIVRVELQKNHVEVQTQFNEQLPAVEGDQIQLQQVILNLVMNAIEAMHSAQPRVLRIQTKLCKPDVVHVSIEDTGTGIDPSDLDHIFEPLFTTKASGMGMGLSICHSIIESHGGRIWASPATNRGSIFQFELPINTAE